MSESGTLWARPSTDEEIKARREAEGNRTAVRASAEKRHCTNGAEVDSHLEAMVIIRKLMEEDRTDDFDDGVCK